MPTFTKEELEALRQGAKARGEQIARRKREIDVLRRAVWLRMDLLREPVQPPRDPARELAQPHARLVSAGPPPARAGATAHGEGGAPPLAGAGGSPGRGTLAPTA